MKRQKVKIQLKTWGILMFCSLMCVFGLFGQSTVPAWAENLEERSAKQYTDVITDLSKDKDFDLSAYPEKPGADKDDYKIDVIQIAESKDKELFIYCYIPCVSVSAPSGEKIELTPTEVSLSITTDINYMTYLLHGLTEVHRYKTLVKYVVRGVEVDTTASKRYYSVSMLQRKWSKYVPGEKEDLTVKAEEIGKLWIVEDTDSGVKYTEKHKETIEILNPIAGAVRYFKDQVPANWGVDAVDSHFIAFDTDLPVDDLLEADVSYIPVAWESDENGNNGGCARSMDYIMAYTEYLGLGRDYIFEKPVISTWLYADKMQPGYIGVPENFRFDKFSEFVYEYERSKGAQIITIKKDAKYSFGTGGWWTENTYTWNRIQDIDSFKSSLQEKNIVHMSGDYSVDDIEKRTWFLRYRETDWDDPDTSIESWFDSYQYSSIRDLDIVVLRLKFETNGTVYDMGTVSNKVDQTEYIQGNTPLSFWESLLAWLEKYWPWIAAAVIAVIILIVLAPFLPTILSGIVALLQLLLKGLWWLLKHLSIALWWIITLPFRAIAAIVRKIRERRGAA